MAYGKRSFNRTYLEKDYGTNDHFYANVPFREQDYTREMEQRRRTPMNSPLDVHKMVTVEKWSDEQGNDYAIRKSDAGSVIHLKNGLHHREDDLPAVVMANDAPVNPGMQQWCVEGKVYAKRDLGEVKRKIVHKQLFNEVKSPADQKITVDDNLVVESHKWQDADGNKFVKRTFPNGTFEHLKNGQPHRDGDEVSATSFENGFTEFWCWEGEVYAKQTKGEQRKVVDKKIFKQIVKSNDKTVAPNSKGPTIEQAMTSKQRQKLLQQAREDVHGGGGGIKSLFKSNSKQKVVEQANRLGFKDFDPSMASYVLLLRDEIDACKKTVSNLKKEVKGCEAILNPENVQAILSTHRVEVGEETQSLSLTLLNDHGVTLSISSLSEIDEDRSVEKATEMIKDWTEFKTGVLPLLEEFLSYPQNCKIGDIQDLHKATINPEKLSSELGIPAELETCKQFFSYSQTKMPADCRVKTIDGQVCLFFLSKDQKGLNPVKEAWYTHLQEDFGVDNLKKLMYKVSNTHAEMINIQDNIIERKAMIKEHIETQALEAAQTLRPLLNREEVSEDIQKARGVLDKWL